MILLWILSIIAIIAVSFYQALRFNPRPRLAVLLLLACAIASTPFLLPPGEKIARFCMALMATLTVFKMWDLHVGLRQGSPPNFREYLALLANLFFLVWRKRGIERQPAISTNLGHLFLGMFGLVALGQMRRVDWSAYPFLFEHTLIATGLFLFVIAELNTFVAVTRLLGGYAVNANDRPLAARTPADFWRRYNRVVGQFLHEDVFKLMQGRRHPLRATLVAFAVSGLMHEYLFWIAIGRPPGLSICILCCVNVCVPMKT